MIELERMTSDAESDDGAPSLEDRCQILRQKIGSLEADIFRAGRSRITLNWPSYLSLRRKNRCFAPVSQGNAKSRIRECAA